MKSVGIILSFIQLMILTGCDKDQGGEQFIPGSDALAGSKWVITFYSIAPAGQLISQNDTLIFDSKSSYRYNDQPKTYFLEQYSWGYKLGLKGTNFGYLIGNVTSDLPTVNSLNGQEFTVYGTENIYYLWFQKI